MHHNAGVHERRYHHGNLRADLLRLAERTLEKSGAENVSLRELSRELGVSSTAPRRHFQNKQALLEALAIMGFERLAVALGRAAARQAAGFDDRIVLLARTYIRWTMRHETLMRLMLTMKHQPNASPDLLAMQARTMTTALQAVADGQAAGEVIAGPPKQLALTIFAAVEGLRAVSDGRQIDGVPLDRVVAGLVRQVIGGLRPRKR